MIVRPYEPADRESLARLFARAGAGSPTERLWGDPVSEAAVYLDPYVEHAPGSLFVAEVDGGLVGYLTGCPDGASFPSENDRFDRAIREHRPYRSPAGAAFFLRSMVDVVAGKVRREGSAEELADPRWPAHLHLNVAPEGRGSGAGSALIDAFLRQADERGVPGVFLQTLVENPGAVRFFERHGFVRFGPTPAVPGLRWRGRRVHQQTMVRPGAGTAQVESVHD